MRTALAVCLGAPWAPPAFPAGSGFPGDVADEDARGARAVVEAQLAAMAKGDDARAFSYASDEIKAQFGDSRRFMDMVRSGYPMVIKPASVSYFRPESVDGALVMRVQMRDRNGDLWLAVYKLVRPKDGRWRIDGCMVQPDTADGTT